MTVRPIRKINYTISEGDDGIYETVNYMWHYALRDTKEALVQQLVNNLIDKENDFITLKNIYNWVWQNVDYALDPPDIEMITAPIHYVNGNRQTGDCDCMTTLLVCLLETAGFDCSITVISWRIDDYTHVFAEVWQNGNWFILDPTLKSEGFGKQDKKVKRYKRTTKRDMAKLQVLSDGGRRLVRKSCKNNECKNNDYKNNEDKNHNANNININFGTNVENSHNRNERAEGRTVGNQELPQMESVFDRNRTTNYRQVIPATILKPTANGNYNVVDKAKSNVIEYETVENETVENNFLAQKLLVNNKRPKYVPNSTKNYYPEFP
jgi:hypothetical protein